AKNILALAKRSGVVVQVGHSERFHAIWEMRGEFKEFFDSIGTIRLNRLGPFKGRATDVDVAQDLMIHDLDLLLWLFNERPKQVTSTGYKVRTDKWDYICSEFTYASGGKAIVTAGRNFVKEVRDMEISSSHGTLFIDLFANEALLASGQAQTPDQYVVKKTYAKRDHLLLEHQKFYQSIQERISPVVSVDEGVAAVYLVEKVIQSLNERRPVDIE
ncbi:MAG: Gfo/Idh/MocA family oxidoreductase, partial [Pseudomonadota bacterium]